MDSDWSDISRFIGLELELLVGDVPEQWMKRTGFCQYVKNGTGQYLGLTLVRYGKPNHLLVEGDGSGREASERICTY